MNLEQAIVQRANSLNVVRLFLAASVIFLHAWPITGRGGTPYPIGVVGGMAVPGFFCLSGFLIARSRMRLSFPRFLWHRALRIFPALWVVLVLIAFVAAPISTLGGGTWSFAETVPFLVTNAVLDPYPHFAIVGTVDNGAWDGSLWSLSYEFAAYIGAGVVLTVGAVRRNAGVVLPVLFVLALFLGWWAPGYGQVTTAFLLRALLLGAYFLAGMCFYFWAHRVRVDWRLATVALLAIALFEVLPESAFTNVRAIPLAYLLLWAGAAIPAKWAQTHDISYGVYIYAGPAQLLVWWLAPGLPFVVLVAAAVAASVGLGWASWLLVERPVMRARNWGRRRPVAETAPAGSPAAHVAG